MVMHEHLNDDQIKYFLFSSQTMRGNNGNWAGTTSILFIQCRLQSSKNMQTHIPYFWFCSVFIVSRSATTNDDYSSYGDGPHLTFRVFSLPFYSEFQKQNQKD